MSPCYLTVLAFLWFPQPFGSYSASPPQQFPELCLMFGSESLHLFPSDAEWHLSNENWVRHQSGQRRRPVPPLLGI